MAHSRNPPLGKFCGDTPQHEAEQGAAPDRLQPALPSLVPRFGRFGFRRRVSLVVVLQRAA